ncbi:phosphate signaling complex protein PhoU [Marinospirillum sp. MEB164]|uniref:Phosphate-specific transport system accessory protein PhoU n=1 Tax=Marinospirillum alkalitolerans TaxID=3123374 RepID=A0ABW8PV52_9GAMM
MINKKNTVMNVHISRQFHQELELIRSQLLEMGGLVEQQMQHAMQALLQADSGLAQQVRKQDKQVNQLQLQLDELCTQVLARRQPAASDLRLVLAVIRATADLERMGDEASKIARSALSLTEAALSMDAALEGDLEQLGQQVRQMLNKVLNAFARFDVGRAREVIAADDQVDQLYRRLCQEWLKQMQEQPTQLSKMMEMMWVLRSLERLGDHASNLAEMLIYLVEGQDVRYRPTPAS